MIKRVVSTSVAAVCALVVTCAVASAQALPSGWSTRDIGSVGATGSASGTTTALSVDAAGADVWGTSDAFRFAYTSLTGDGSVVAKVTSVENVNAWTKAGVMMRETLAANSRQAFMLVSPGKGLAFQRRTATGGLSASTPGGGGTAPSFVKLTRAGSTFRASRSVDGVNWTTVGSATITMGSRIYVGIAVSSHVSGVLATATFGSTAVTAGSVATAPPVVSPTSKTTLRVLHWNTHHGGIGSDGKYDPNRIATWIKNMNPDMASLNEVDTQAQVNAIVTSLTSKTGVTWNVSFSGRGNLVLSRLPMSNKSTCLYAPSYGSSAAHLSAIVNGRNVNLWATHLHVSSASARLAEVKVMQGCAQNWSEGRILAGDYNMQAGSTEYNAAVVGYTDAWPAAKALGTTTNYSGNCDGCTRNSRIDYVFTSKGATFLTLKSAQIFDTRDANGVMASDHKPLLVTYTVN